MPYIWIDDRVAVDKEEICLEYFDRDSDKFKLAKKTGVDKRLWNTYNALKIELYRYQDKKYGIKRLMRGGNGRQLLIDFDSLPADIQDFLGDPRKVDNPLEKHYSITKEIIDYYSSFKRNGLHLKAQEQERYIINAAVMNAVVALENEKAILKRNLGAGVRGMMVELLNETIMFNKVLKAKHDVTHSLPGTLRHFKNSLKEFKNEGMYSLIKDPQGNRRDNARKVDDMVLEIINGLFDEDYKPNRTEIARSYDAFLAGYASVYNKKTGELYSPKGFPKLSQGTITSYLAKWEYKIGNEKKRTGNRQQYIAKFMPHGQMDLPVYAGSIISIDDRNPPFWYEKGKRMWFYIGIDVASGCFTTFVYGKTKEGIILDFYRQMVRNYAEWGLCLPAELECESSLNSSFKETFLSPGRMFDFVKIEANNAQGKIIERRFGQMRYEVEKKAPGWIARPFARLEHNQGRTEPTEIIPYNELVQARLADLEDWNNMPHHTDPTQSRYEYFLNNQHPNLKPINYASILPYLGYEQTTSCSRGFITLQGRRRAIAENGSILTGEALIEKMKLIEGNEVKVFWLDDNEGEVLKALVYYQDRLICEAMEMPRFNRARIEQTAGDSEAIELQSHYTNTVAQFARQQANSVVKIGLIDKTPKPERKFKISNLRRYEANEQFEEVEILPDEQEEIMYNPNAAQSAGKGWRSTFINK